MRKSKENLLVLIFLLGVGFSIVSTYLYVNGSAFIGVNSGDFNVKFTKAFLDNVDVSSSAISSDGKTITFTTSDLSLVGDKSKLNFEVTNNSLMYDAAIKITCSSLGEKNNYYSITKNMSDKIAAKRSESGSVEVELLKASVDDFQEEFSCILNANALEKTTNAVYSSFNDDSWDEILENVKSGHANYYKVGDTKTINMDNFGNHTLRIANISECSNGETSETACGFVVEFADILEKRSMNSSYTSAGGWPACELRSYINSYVYNSLPDDLKNVIATTKVVSGHDNTSSVNFVSNDKLYLFSAKEIWNGGTECDTSENVTRQLDYYKSQGVNRVIANGAIKKYNGASSTWWLSTPFANGNSSFFYVGNTGIWNYGGARNEEGVSPAFRIK